MPEKEKSAKTKNFLENKNNQLVIVVIIVLVIGIVVGTQLQKPSAPTTKEPIKISTEKEADSTTTDLGNRIAATTGSIDKIIDSAQK